jgi:hypothetical protein
MVPGLRVADTCPEDTLPDKILTRRIPGRRAVKAEELWNEELWPSSRAQGKMPSVIFPSLPPLSRKSKYISPS